MDVHPDSRTRADEQRFRALFESAYPALRRYAYYRGLTGADAEDLVAEVLTIAWRRLDVVPVDDPTPWLFAVARNVWRNQLRSAARREAFEARCSDRNITGPAEASSAPTVDEIRRALSALNDDDREVLRLAAWDGLTPAQVAVVLGCSSTAARVRLHRARRRFARHLDEAETRRTEATDLHRDPRSEEVPDERRNTG